MTIASEIERLQEAKADIKSSIEWKWVSVPSSAKLDTYDTYIDQIQQWDGGILTKWIKLYPFHLNTYWIPATWWIYSWFDWNVYYGLNFYSYYISRDDEYYYWVLAYKKDLNWDITYRNSDAQLYGSYNGDMLYSYFYKKWNEIRCYTVTRNNAYPSEYWGYAWIWYTWNYNSNTITQSWSWRSPDYTPENRWVDLTWWTQVSWSEWVDSVTSTIFDNDIYLYLTLK